MFLTKIVALSLTHYRNFSYFKYDFDNNKILFIGANGSGKTSILEAISLLSPGRGIRGDHFEDMCMFGKNEWMLDIYLVSKLGPAHVNICYNKHHNKRNITYNGKKASISELTKLVDVVWLSPVMHHIFTGASSERRKFFDRIVFSFYNTHATNLTLYDKLLSSRLKYLIEHKNTVHLPMSNNFLTKLETQIAEVAIKIHQARQQTVDILQKELANLTSHFPVALISVINEHADYLCHQDKYVAQIAAMRQIDALKGRSSFGPHKDDLLVFYQAANKSAKYCSMGEQKALMISVIMAQIMSVTKYNNFAPLLLLDEVFVHLDETNKKLLDYMLNCYDLQYFITNTIVDDVISFNNTTIIDLNNLHHLTNGV